MTETPLLHGLPAQVEGDCRVLVLGSMPGAASLAQARYYAHPRNRFWPLMAQILQFDPALDYPQRLQALARGRVGVWDVIGTCIRPGSLDAAIARDSVVANPLPALIASLPELRVVACNGGAALRAWQNHVAPQLDKECALPVLGLPSTSPANAACALPRLLHEWLVLRPFLGP